MNEPSSSAEQSRLPHNWDFLSLSVGGFELAFVANDYGSVEAALGDGSEARCYAEAQNPVAEGERFGRVAEKHLEVVPLGRRGETSSSLVPVSGRLVEFVVRMRRGLSEA